MTISALMTNCTRKEYSANSAKARNGRVKCPAKIGLFAAIEVAKLQCTTAFLRGIQCEPEEKTKNKRLQYNFSDDGESVVHPPFLYSSSFMWRMQHEPAKRRLRLKGLFGGSLFMTLTAIQFETCYPICLSRFGCHQSISPRSCIDKKGQNSSGKTRHPLKN